MATKNQNKRSIPRYTYTQFTWHKGNGCTDASDLGIPVGAEPGERVYADACDVGFLIVGEREEKLFTLDHVEQPFPDLSGVNAWVFTSDDGKHQVTICND